MISQATIDKIMDAARIDEVVSDYVALKRRGANYVACCPFHDERTPSFSVSPSRGIFKCFGCGKGGNAVIFVMEHEKVSYVEALKIVGKKYHIEIEERELTPDEKRDNDARESMMLVNAYAQAYFAKTLHNHTDGKTIGLTYFAERGFLTKTIEKFQLGYCLDRWTAFSDVALREGYRKEFLLTTGLSTEGKNGNLLDRFRGRVIFPIHNLSGRVIGFAGRTLKTDKTVAKYVNSPESVIYTKGKTLYGIFFAKKAIANLDKCYLVEGQTDVISMHQAGIENVVASGGTSLTTEQIHLIRRFTPNITVLYDGDAAGIKASMRGIDMLLEEGMNVKTLLLPDGEDPDSFARSHSATELSDFIAAHEENFISFKAKILLADASSDPLRKAEAVGDMVRSIAAIPDAMKRSLFVREAARLLDVDEPLLANEVRNAVLRQRDKRSKESGAAAQHHSDYEAALARDGDPNATSQLSADVLQTPAIPAFVKNVFCREQERELIYFLLKHGTESFYDSRVDRFIISEIVNEELNFQNLEYRQIFEEYQRLIEANELVSEAHFTHHPSTEISKLASDVIADRYTLSKIWNRSDTAVSHEDYLKKGIPKSIASFKQKLIILAIQKYRTELASATNKADEATGMVEKIRELNELKRQLSKVLDRPVS
ncbi:MAG: DNA primase [Prevotellaceae bacterium]|jgi:DNA primase|nr:DNA primase [Prevotellaceae bacterium]